MFESKTTSVVTLLTGHPSGEEEVFCEAWDAAAPQDRRSSPPAELDLSSVLPKARLHGWELVTATNNEPPIDVASILGSLVKAGAVRTSPVVGYDPRTRRVLTRNCSVYQLGLPDLRFALDHRSLLQRLGI
jgi:hypothetical protein